MRTRKKKVRTSLVNKVLLNWTELTSNLTKLTEEELQSALDKELAGERRASFVSRLSARHIKVRGMNEKEATMSRIK